ncbi:hypothetical protein [Glaciecola sp. MF2-115]|uniref:hypothetical protein n=1 Tax=Glaciecola sp. MF2-115 TaxID=3384827 RepID=UPI0039A1E85A
MKLRVPLSITKLGLLCIMCAPGVVSASLLVVGNVDPPITLSKSEVKAIFMGGANSHQLKAVALPPENKTRKQFNAKVVGMTESRIQSYWAQMRFSGRQKPPREFANEQQLLDYLLENPGTVAYVSSEVELDERLVVLYQVGN